MATPAASTSLGDSTPGLADTSASAADSLTAPAPAPDLEKLKRYFTEARQLTETARTKSLQAIDYYDTDQLVPQQIEELRKRHQPEIVINRIKPAINGIVGVIERGRSDPRAWPREPEKADQADVATDVLRYVAGQNRFKQVKSDCFFDMLIPGTMAAIVGVDPDLQVTVTQIRWEEFFGDPRSRRKDWLDARYLGIAKWMYAALRHFSPSRAVPSACSFRTVALER